MQSKQSSAVLNLVKTWIRPEIRAFPAYHVPKTTGLIKLDAMENPYTWPEGLRQELAVLLQKIAVNRYPDPEATNLKAQLQEQFGIPDGAGILLGNGSDELIQILALALGASDQVVLALEPSFVMYRMITTWARLKYIGIPLLKPDFTLDTDAVLAAIQRYQPALVFIAYPNNPTGNLFAAEALQRIIQAATGLVVVDEAYAPFTDASFLKEIFHYPNLMVLRTLSKMGLAGLRLGYLVGHPIWIKELDKTRMPYNINVLTQVTAEFALRHRQMLDEQTAKIRLDREQLWQQLANIPGLEPYPSAANFILFRLPQAPLVMNSLKAEGVLIKCLHGSNPLLNDCLRVTVGTPAENEAFLTALLKTIRTLGLKPTVPSTFKTT